MPRRRWGGEESLEPSPISFRRPSMSPGFVPRIDAMCMALSSLLFRPCAVFWNFLCNIIALSIRVIVKSFPCFCGSGFLSFVPIMQAPETRPQGVGATRVRNPTLALLRSCLDLLCDADPPGFLLVSGSLAGSCFVFISLYPSAHFFRSKREGRAGPCFPS